MKRKRLTRKALVIKGMSIGAVAMRAILDGKDVEATVAAVKKAYRKAHTGRNSVLWYRSELKRRGEKVPPLARKATEKPKKKEGKKGTSKFHKVPPGTIAAAAPARKAATA